MNTRTRRHIIENIKRNSSDTQAFDPTRPLPHIICPEARPHMEKSASVWPPLLAGVVIGTVVGIAAVTYFS